MTGPEIVPTFTVNGKTFAKLKDAEEYMIDRQRAELEAMLASHIGHMSTKVSSKALLWAVSNLKELQEYADGMASLITEPEWLGDNDKCPPSVEALIEASKRFTLSNTLSNKWYVLDMKICVESEDLILCTSLDSRGGVDKDDAWSWRDNCWHIYTGEKHSEDKS